MEQLLANVRSQTICTVSGDEYDKANALLFRFRRRGTKVVSVPNSPPTSTVRAGSAQSLGNIERQLGSERTQVVTIGRVLAQKDPKLYAEVAELVTKFADVQFCWIGDGDAASVRTLEASGVEVTGWLSPQKVQERLNQSHLYLHTASWEGAPFATVEAAAMGIPVISRDIPSMRSLGYAMGGTTAEELALSVGTFISSRQYSQRVRSVTAEVLRNNNRGKMKAQVESLYSRDERFSVFPSSSMLNVVVCSTPRGGHIEHAYDLSRGLNDATGLPTLLITSKGAAEYLAVESGGDGVWLDEHLSGHWVYNSSLLKFGRLRLLGLARLVVDNILLWWTLRKHRSIATMILEEPRYPAAALISAFNTVLFAHNARQHESTPSGSYVGRAKELAQAFQTKIVDLVATHGDSQRKTLESQTECQVVSVPLPTKSYLATEASSDEPPAVPPEMASAVEGKFVLAIGEIRWNKGIDIIAEACVKMEVRLIVAGDPVDADALTALTSAAQHAPALVTVYPRFMTREEFDFLLSHASVVSLTYRQFDASSGVASRAMSLGKTLICTPVPSLTEQVRGYDRALVALDFAQESISATLERALESAALNECQQTPGSDSAEREWCDLAKVLSGERARSGKS